MPIDSGFGLGLLNALLGRRALYRGRRLPELNQDEFQDNTIDGNTYRIVRVRMTTDQIDQMETGFTLDALPGILQGVDTVHVTGGLSENVGTAVHFSGGADVTNLQLPLILALDPDRIVGDVVRVDYTYDWFNAHPGALAHVDTTAKGEIRVNGDLWGLLREGNRAVFVSLWGQDQVMERAEFMQFSEEEERIAFAREIPLDASFLGSASVYDAKPASSFSPTQVASSVLDERALQADQEDLVPRLHQAVLNQSRMDVTPYWTLLVDPFPRKRDDGIPRSAVEGAYDGEQFRSPDAVPRVLLGT